MALPRLPERLPRRGVGRPTPCDFCNSTAIERVDLATPLRDPDPPWNMFVGGILGVIERGLE